MQTLSWLTFGIALFTTMAFDWYFKGHRPPHAVPSSGLLYPVTGQGYVVYLTSREHVLVNNYWMLVAGISFLLHQHRERGDPFASKSMNFRGARDEFINQRQVDGYPESSFCSIIGGYLAALLLLIATLIFRAFRAS